jgi:hypothetical protein
MSYWLRGFGDAGPQPTYTPENCAATDSACVQRNAVANANFGAAMAAWQVQNNLDGCIANANQNPNPAAAIAQCNANYSGGGAGYDAATSIPYTGGGSSPVVSGGRVSFATGGRGRSGSPYVGDTYQISIAGATPNSPVTVSGNGPSGSYQGTAMGSTDANGNFSKAGSFGAGDVGNWSEAWAVGGVPSGQFTFPVNAPIPVLPPSIPLASTGSSPVPSAAAASLAPVAAATSTFSFSSIPWWGWAAGAGVALLGFGGGSHGR